MVFRVCPTVGALLTLKGLPFLTTLWLSDVSNKEGGRKEGQREDWVSLLSELSSPGPVEKTLSSSPNRWGQIEGGSILVEWAFLCAVQQASSSIAPAWCRKAPRVFIHSFHEMYQRPDADKPGGHTASKVLTQPLASWSLQSNGGDTQLSNNYS